MSHIVVDVMLKPEILDPQGQAVTRALPELGIAGVQNVRIGKHVEIEIDDGAEEPLRLAEQIADRLLANGVIETFRVHQLSD